jgi:hypothetical protein
MAEFIANVSDNTCGKVLSRATSVGDTQTPQREWGFLLERQNGNSQKGLIFSSSVLYIKLTNLSQNFMVLT